MSVVVLENVSITLGGRTLFDELSLRLSEQDRVGLIGPNGSGKTTLMRVLAGASQPDGGAVRPRKDSRIAYLPQDVTTEGGRSLMRFIRESVPGRTALEADIERTDKALTEASQATDAPDYEELTLQLAGRIGELHERLADYDRFYGDHEAQRILAGLGFKDSDHDRDLGEFSGGWKMRAVLASLLFQRPDLLLLDEPTNHLDMPSVGWLSGFLQQQSYGLVLISHDREFLNEQINRVVRANQAAVRYCYEVEVQRQPNLRGRIEIAWRISLAGRVTTSRVARSTMNNSRVEGCIARQGRNWRFPEPDGQRSGK